MGRGPGSIRSGFQHRSVRAPSTIYFFASKNTQALLYNSINSTFGIGYGVGAAEGIAYRDTVVIGEATGPRQFIGAANQTNGFHLVEPFDGIRTFPFDFLY